MIECESQGNDMTAGALDSSRGDVRAASDSEMMLHREVHVGKCSRVARHVPLESRLASPRPSSCSDMNLGGQ
ncbi:hypothetical protein Taro_039010 [Colocasia esculenta]|uniref:Uncharacterized protein n=1 Tax=Colocasia esculenta TaxID=4460 RepID=A0A843WUD9_COLES|nr:hypothetical protein [Colocasia esculenta]